MYRIPGPFGTKPLSAADLSRRDALKAFGGLAATLPLNGLFSGRLLADGDPSKAQADKLALRFAKYYELIAVDVKPKVPAHALPLDPTKVANWKEASAALGLAADEPSLRKNGFAVLPGKGNEDIVRPYTDLKRRGVPLFVTADTLLHLYHVQFDETLKDIEEREFYKDVVALAETMVKELANQPLPADDGDFRAARHKALTFFAIGLKALKPDAALPDKVASNEIDEVLEQMKKHEGFWPNPDLKPCPWKLFRYSEDFSQYVPRGHYTRSEVLKKYFVGMMWFGRLTFLLKGEPSDKGALVSTEEATRQTLAAALVTKLMAGAKLADGRKAYDVWERLYAVTSFYVGLSDDLGMAEYKAALTKVCGAALDLAALADPNKLQAFKLEMARHAPPAIYSGTGAQAGPLGEAGPGDLLKALAASTGFRFMGQRFVPDSYMMGKLVYPTVGDPTRDGMFTRIETPAGPIRGFPRGLDVLTVLGSTRARQLTHDLGDDAYQGGEKSLSYADALAAVQKEYAKLTAKDWNRNLYWSWLYALQPLLAEFGPGYPTFMSTEAYRTKSLNTALASWAQLRHDTILYVKQSYTMVRPTSAPIRPKPVQGYVEPVPEFYARLLALTRMTNRGLTEMKVLDAAATKRLDAFDKLLDRLLTIAKKELADQELTEADYAFIRDFGSNLQAVVVPPKPGKEPGSIDHRSMKTTLVADVHTDQNSQQVLEEGTGYVDLGVFVYRQPDGRLVLGAGPVLSYYEFKHPMKDRLTDEKWRELLKKKEAPAAPAWTKAYVSAKASYICAHGEAE